MSNSQPTQDYLAKAKLAEEEAARAADAVHKRSYLTMAQRYRQLARFVERQTTGMCWGDPAAE
jgi:hypothetical protein